MPFSFICTFFYKKKPKEGSESESELIFKKNLKRKNVKKNI